MNSDANGTQRVPDEWYVGFHRGLAARFWRAAAATMAEDDARVVLGVLDLPPGAAVLDVPCGDGRLTRRLAAAATFLAGDLRALPDVGPQDAIVSGPSIPSAACG